MPSDAPLRCRVCGYRNADPPWGLDGRTPLFDSCPCCGVEFGYQDATMAGARRYRRLWLASGAGWRDEVCRPAHWDLQEQLSHVPAEFR